MGAALLAATEYTRFRVRFTATGEVADQIGNFPATVGSPTLAHVLRYRDGSRRHIPIGQFDEWRKDGTIEVLPLEPER